MKKLFKLILFLTVAGIMFSSCEGPMGPTGADGIDANANCTECHSNNQIITAKMAQWNTSIHATGGNAPYASNNNVSCVKCHTSQGFLEYVAEGSAADLTIPAEPLQINCYTCHKIHSTFTEDDWDLTLSGPQVLDVQYAGDDVIWDKGTSNLCASCHQTLPVTPAPVENGPDFEITNIYFGTHHAPMANLVLGKTAFELTGTAYPTSNYHSTADGCVTCHMSAPYGDKAGGHNMGLKYNVHGSSKMLYTGCTDCHDVTTPGPAYGTLAFDAKIAAVYDNIEDKLEKLAAQLAEAGLYNTETGRPNKGTFEANAVYAYINYSMIVDDRSLSLHNPPYIKVLLDNSIAAMAALGYGI